MRCVPLRLFTEFDVNSFLEGLGSRLARYLAAPVTRFQPTVVSGREAHWERVIQPGDVLLVEGNSRISAAVKYLTHSTWSHAALCIGNAAAAPLIEADVVKGVIVVPFEKYLERNVRICRPVGLSADDLQALTAFAIARIGNTYDLKNIFDLLRYLLPTPPVPARFRRRLITFGSGEPTKAICSSLIAEAFQSVRYPVLPDLWPLPRREGNRTAALQCSFPQEFPMPANETINLWPDGSPHNPANDRPRIEVYLPKEKSDKPVPAVVVCPGGGYGGRAGHEGAPFAELFAAQGFVSFVCHYRVSPNRHPAPMTDVCRAIRLVRSRAKDWNIDEHKIALMGFSAGGHLASTVATQ
ncbi:MAG: alpha/beta hydrolase fold domain-containing protein, partial [Gammaproteobacteria bacterium]|nr:alpha/beta hydrolase fold domain-containing protein [Gammaproteobacteria bacterium]